MGHFIPNACISIQTFCVVDNRVPPLQKDLQYVSTHQKNKALKKYQHSEILHKPILISVVHCMNISGLFARCVNKKNWI